MPVISMIIYPFQTRIPTSPLIVKSGHESLITFHYKVFPLFTLEAEKYIREQAISMYPLLPTMQGANATLLLEAIDGLKQFYKDERLSRRLFWFRTLLQRVKTIPVEDKIQC